MLKPCQNLITNVKDKLNFKRLKIKKKNQYRIFFSKTKFSNNRNCKISLLVASIDDEAKKKDLQGININLKNLYLEHNRLLNSYFSHSCPFQIDFLTIRSRFSIDCRLEKPNNERNCSKYRSVSKRLSPFISNTGLFVYYQSSQVFPI